MPRVELALPRFSCTGCNKRSKYPINGQLSNKQCFILTIQCMDESKRIFASGRVSSVLGELQFCNGSSLIKDVLLRNGQLARKLISLIHKDPQKDKHLVHTNTKTSNSTSYQIILSHLIQFSIPCQQSLVKFCSLDNMFRNRFRTSRSNDISSRLI